MCTKVAANDMVERSVAGRIIFIASTRGIRAYPEDNIYGSLKAALIRSVQSLALSLAEHNITVNCIAPGATKVRGDLSPKGLTEGYLPGKIPLKRYGSPEEVGYLAAFIASDEAGYITGETIKIDGGLILPGMKEKQ
jgi:NAD(P)-dependent dehydrogenase (short-subunit alcohol dehydrogenase family)